MSFILLKGGRITTSVIIFLSDYPQKPSWDHSKQKDYAIDCVIKGSASWLWRDGCTEDLAIPGRQNVKFRRQGLISDSRIKVER